MKILVTGGTGLIGQKLVNKLEERGHTVTILSRNPKTQREFRWDIDRGEIDEKAFDGVEAIVHLAGASIGKRWTSKYREELYKSRVSAADLLLKKAKEKNVKLSTFITASGSNYYGTFTSEQILTEEMQPQHNDFLSDLSAAWERPAEQFSEISERIVAMRTSVVLAREGGTLPLLKKLVKMNLGSPVGTGRQWMNWIHLDDLVDLYLFALENPNIQGPINAVATPERNAAFMKKLCASENKMFVNFSVPGFILKTLLGEMSSLLLEGTRLSSEKTKNSGFTFRFERLDEALKDLR